jgi:hypothetical protein
MKFMNQYVQMNSSVFTLKWNASKLSPVVCLKENIQDVGGPKIRPFM